MIYNAKISDSLPIYMIHHGHSLYCYCFWKFPFVLWAIPSWNLGTTFVICFDVKQFEYGIFGLKERFLKITVLVPSLKNYRCNWYYILLKTLLVVLRIRFFTLSLLSIWVRKITLYFENGNIVEILKCPFMPLISAGFSCSWIAFTRKFWKLAY